MKYLHTAWLLICISTAAVAQETALTIVQKADDLMRGKTMYGQYTLTIIRPEWQRTMVFKFWSEGTEKSFILMLAPAKDRGVTFLKIKREMWNYIPKINREIKIPPSMMLQSWMGSDFTNDDLVKESSVVTDYTHTLLGREQEAGFEAYKVELKPKPEAPVVWGRIIEWIRVADYLPLRAQYFNERGELVRTLVFSDIKEMGGRVIPAKFELIEEKKPGRRTVMLLEEAVFDKPIKKSVFTKQYLRRAR
ncbi:MAG: outer membrane lipoprotein-sorting protein [bacterium]